MQKQARFKVKGMQKDLSVSAFNPEYAYDNKNIRIMPTDDSTLFTIINEKGNEELYIDGIENGVIKYTPIGQVVLNNELIVFTAGNTVAQTDVSIIPNIDDVSTITSEDITIDIDSDVEDRIFKIWFDSNNNIKGERLYRGFLNFDYKNPIEAVSLYENDNLKKVYWVDGKNQPRVINTSATQNVKNSWNNTSFDFTRILNLQEQVSITKNIGANGKFSSGIIQYAFTYYNKYGQESNIFHTSPIYYITATNRGLSPEESVGNSFNINITSLDTSFEYVRIYSIHRASINSTPNVKRVVDINVPSSATISYTDNGIGGDSLDPTELLYVGGEEVVFGTLSHKDNTLFFGDITIKRPTISNSIKDFFKNKSIVFKNSDQPYPKKYLHVDPIGYYSYENQLHKSSLDFKTFKYLETYRLGVQFQHITGKWSEPIWINDVRNTSKIETKYIQKDYIYLPEAVFNFNDLNIIKSAVSQGYVKIRPVIVYPSITDREIICQGVLCPTVYNVSDRYSNSPFAQASWITRPNAPYDNTKAFQYMQDGVGNWVWDLQDRVTGGYGNYSTNSRAGAMSNNRTIVTIDEVPKDIDTVNFGAWAEFRHNNPIPSNNKRNSEIQCIWNPPNKPTISDATDIITNNWVMQNSENYYIDQSIVTLHSPDIEFDDSVKNLDMSNLKLRIVGMVPITSSISDINIQTSTAPNNFKDAELAPGFYKEKIGAENISRQGFKTLLSGVFWFDDLSGRNGTHENTDKLSTGFVVYPWHREGSLNNCKFAKDGVKSALLETKRTSNLRYSYNSFYFNTTDIWEAYKPSHNTNTGVSGIMVYDSNEMVLVKIPAPKNSGLADINYYGNVDKVLNISRVGDKKDGYPIMTSGTQNSAILSHLLFSADYIQVNSTYTDEITGVDPVRIKYKTTPHAVLALNYTNGTKYQRVLPTLKDGDVTLVPIGIDKWDINSVDGVINYNESYFWDKNKDIRGVSQDVLDISFLDFNGSNLHQGYGPEYGWLWLGEIYNDNVVNRFGGQTQEAFENNQWLPCGLTYSLINSTTNIIEDSIEIKWTEGDTYYQRYDHLKVYPYTQEDSNSMVDIISFMCETRVNIDGRYDRNRGQTSNFHISPTNFNLLNPVYSQQNNFFNYRILNPKDTELNNFKNTITWTKTKTLGENVDTWTNITLASILDLDGDKGSVRAIKRFNNDIIAFQDKGISNILFNSRTQLSTNEGVPVEIANSGKVEGKRYLSDKIGCTNKWSICETGNGIYFVDDITKAIFLFNGNLENLSDKLGFHSWINRVSQNTNLWNPVDFNNIVTYYDKVNGDVFFITKDECLAFSEPLASFSSFYSYEGTPYFTNLNDRGLAINTAKTGNIFKVWAHNEGDYNNYYGKYSPFSTTVIVNADINKYKIFNNLEFRSDSWDIDNTLLSSTFDTLEVWNEYQHNKVSLENIIGSPSNLKQKFRTWRANIPRDKDTNMDRMRNYWLYVKLSMDKENTNKTMLHDITVTYFD